MKIPYFFLLIFNLQHDAFSAASACALAGAAISAREYDSEDDPYFASLPVLGKDGKFLEPLSSHDRRQNQYFLVIDTCACESKCSDGIPLHKGLYQRDLSLHLDPPHKDRAFSYDEMTQIFHLSRTIATMLLANRLFRTIFYKQADFPEQFTASVGDTFKFHVCTRSKPTATEHGQYLVKQVWDLPVTEYLAQKALDWASILMKKERTKKPITAQQLKEALFEPFEFQLDLTDCGVPEYMEQDLFKAAQNLEVFADDTWWYDDVKKEMQKNTAQ